MNNESVNKYVLVTAARNEEQHIGNIIESVLNQTLLPERWVIVSDGSIDRTDDIVQGYTSKYDFIRYVRSNGNNYYSFASKVYAIHIAIEQLKDTRFDFVGTLDADILLPGDYYETILDEFAKDPRLGIAGGIIAEPLGREWVNQNISLNSVAGAVQLFRRECYEAIGGLLPLRYGGEDAAAEIEARMRGWAVQTFPRVRALHDRRVGNGNGNILKARVREGKMFYDLGYDPFFFLLRSIHRFSGRPYVFGSMLQMFGFCWNMARGDRASLPEDVIRYLRHEQMNRMKCFKIFRR